MAANAAATCLGGRSKRKALETGPLRRQAEPPSPGGVKDLDLRCRSELSLRALSSSIQESTRSNEQEVGSSARSDILDGLRPLEDRGCARLEHYRSLASSWVFLSLRGSADRSWPARGSWCVSLPHCTGSAYPRLHLRHPQRRAPPPQTLLFRASRALSPIRRSCRESYQGSQPH